MSDDGNQRSPELTDAQRAVLEFCCNPPLVMRRRNWKVPPLGSSVLKAVEGCFPEYDGAAERLINDLYKMGLVTISPVTVDVYGLDLEVPRVTQKGKRLLAENEPQAD